MWVTPGTTLPDVHGIAFIACAVGFNSTRFLEALVTAREIILYRREV